MKMKLHLKLMTCAAVLLSATTVFSQTLMPVSDLKAVTQNQTSNLKAANTVATAMKADKLLKVQDVTNVSPKASMNIKYTKPKGIYNFSYNMWKDAVSGMVFPLKKDITLTNQSTGATSYVWDYTNSEDKGSQTSTAKDLTFSVFLPMLEGVESPTLTGSDGTSNSSFYYGDNLYAGGRGWTVDNIVPEKRIFYYNMDDAGNMLYGSNSTYQWSTVWELFEAPISPVLMEGINALLYVDKEYPNVDVTVTLSKVTREGNTNNIEEPMWSKVVKLGDGMLEIDFDKPILMNTTFVVGISIAYSPSVTWSLIVQALPESDDDDAYKEPSLMLLAGADVPAQEIEKGGIYFQPTHSMITPKMAYPFMYNVVKDGDGLNIYGDVIELNDTEIPEGLWTLWSMTPIKTIASDANWFRATDIQPTEDANIYSYVMSADAYAGEPRLAHVTATDEYGFSTVFTFGQGGANISSNTLPGVKVIGYENGKLNLNYDAAIYNSVEVYDLTGAKIMEANLTGQNSIPATLVQGAYIVKFNGAKQATVKTIVK